MHSVIWNLSTMVHYMGHLAVRKASVWLDSQPLEEVKCKSLCTDWKPEQIHPET